MRRSGGRAGTGTGNRTVLAIHHHMTGQNVATVLAELVTIEQSRHPVAIESSRRSLWRMRSLRLWCMSLSGRHCPVHMAIFQGICIRGVWVHRTVRSTVLMTGTGFEV